jgi:hypothetical protein
MIVTMKSCTVNSLAFVVLISLLSSRAVRTSTAFVVVSKQAPQSEARTTIASRETRLFVSSGETEVEKLLRMARELRAAAEQTEKEVVGQRDDRKADKEAKFGSLLNYFFYDGSSGKDVGTPETPINDQKVVVDKLLSKQPSKETLQQFVEWIDDRRDIALGNEHVESKGDGKYAAVRSKKNPAEAERLFELIERLLNALEVIDKHQHGNDGHLGGGENAELLRRRLRGKRRERDEQYLERQKSFVEAQRIKEGKSKYEYHDEFLDDLE